MWLYLTTCEFGGAAAPSRCDLLPGSEPSSQERGDGSVVLIEYWPKWPMFPGLICWVIP